MDELEGRMAIMGLGTTAYGILLGAQAGGANLVDSIAVVTAFFLSGYFSTELDREEEDDA